MTGPIIRFTRHGRIARLIRFVPIGVVLLLAAAGCGHDKTAPGHPHVTTPLAPVCVEPWTYDTKTARRVVTPHYVIYTTIEDREFLTRVGHVMEGAFAEYRQLTGDLPAGGEPMVCYLFLTRDQWAQFTRHSTGPDAAIYLHINRGGYTVGDWYVAYFIGDVGTFSVAAHEGFHQYAARHFRNRIPPFLEEGIACMFEDIRWDGTAPWWDMQVNSGRFSSLRTAIDQKRLFTLKQLSMIHAGQVVNGPPGRIAAFYGQSWAFTRFLCDGEGGRYRRGLQRMMADAAAGRLFAASPADSRPAGAAWDPRSAPAQLEHYFGDDITTLDHRFQAYVSHLVNREIRTEDNSLSLLTDDSFAHSGSAGVSQ